MESQMTRPYGHHDQAEDPIRIHHPEDEAQQEKGASKVLKKVKEKAKKIKNSLTKPGHGHEHDQDLEEEDDEYDEQDPVLHGAPAYESSAVKGGVTGQPESLSHPGETNLPASEEIIPPGTKVFPVVSSDNTKPIEPEPEIAESLGRMKVTDESPYEKSGQGFQRDVPTRSHDSGLKNESRCGEGFPAAFGGESGAAGIGKDFPMRSHEFDQKNDSGIDKNSQTVLTSGSIAGLGEDFPARSHELGKESGIGKDSPTGFGGESGAGLEQDFPARSDDVKVETGLGRDLPTGTHDQFSPELSPPKESNDFDSKAEDTSDESKPSTYAEKIGSATSFVTDKAIAAKNAVASKLGYSGETTGGGVKQESPLGDETLRSSGQHESPVGEETPRSATGYGQKVAGTVAEKLTPVNEKVKKTGSTVMTKLPLSGGGSGAEEKQQVEDRGMSPRGYMAEKLRPGEDDKALSEMIAEKLHLGGGGEKKATTTKEVEKIPSDQKSVEREHGDVIAEEGKGGGGGGMVGKVKGAVTSWLGGSKEEVKPKSLDSGEKSSQSLGTTVGTMGFSDSGGAVPTQRGLQESSN